MNRFKQLTRSIIKLIARITLAALIAVSSISVAVAAGSSDESAPDPSKLMKKAEKMIYKGQNRKAIKSLNKIVKEDNGNADAWNLIGYASRQSGDFDAASSAYIKALDINADHLGALEYQGELFIKLGKLEDASLAVRVQR